MARNSCHYDISYLNMKVCKVMLGPSPKDKLNRTQPKIISDIVAYTSST